MGYRWTRCILDSQLKAVKDFLLLKSCIIMAKNLARSQGYRDNEVRTIRETPATTQKNAMHTYRTGLEGWTMSHFLKGNFFQRSCAIK